MKARTNDLGRLITVHGMSPAYKQQAVFIIVLSFLFFLSTMLAFYMLGSFLYFLLASGFLVVYLVSLISFLTQRRYAVRTYENGMEYRAFLSRWEDIGTVKWKADRRSRILVIECNDRPSVSIPSSIDNIEHLAMIIAKSTNKKVLP